MLRVGSSAIRPRIIHRGVVWTIMFSENRVLYAKGLVHVCAVLSSLSFRAPCPFSGAFFLLDNQKSFKFAVNLELNTDVVLSSYVELHVLFPVHRDLSWFSYICVQCQPWGFIWSGSRWYLSSSSGVQIQSPQVQTACQCNISWRDKIIPAVQPESEQVICSSVQNEDNTECGSQAMTGKDVLWQPHEGTSGSSDQTASESQDTHLVSIH